VNTVTVVMCGYYSPWSSEKQMRDGFRIRDNNYCLSRTLIHVWKFACCDWSVTRDVNQMILLITADQEFAEVE